MTERTTDMRIKMPWDLWQHLYNKAIEENVGLGEYTLMALAKGAGRKDLGKLRRNRPGRPRKIAEAK